jgi:hypothetical protein
MDLSIINYSGQPLVILTSDTLYDKQFIANNMPDVKDLLSQAANQGWLSSLEGGVYADSIDNIVMKIRQSLSPQILYQDFILAGDTAFMRNIFVPAKYIYCIGISTEKRKLALTFNVFSTDAAVGKYLNAEDLVTTLKLYIGYRGNTDKFYCDNLTPDGDPVCQEALPSSARFINDMYESRHNPKITQMATTAPDGIPFEDSMISTAEIRDKIIMRNAPLGNTIPPAGLDGQTFVAYLYLANNNKSSFAMSSFNPKQNFTITQPSSSWAPIAILFFVLLIIAVVVGIGMYMLKKSGSINIYGSSQETEAIPSQYI